MLLREMTSSALAHSFKRFARCAVAGLALAGLTACGGGGGGGSASPAPTTPEITITPVDPEAVPTEMFDAATDVVADTPVDGELESADDVKYYRLEVAERSEFEFTLDAEAGIEITILDSDGSVIATAETASEATTTVSAPAGNLFVRIRDKGKLGWDRLNQTKGVKAFNWVAKRVAVIQNLFNIIRKIPHVNLTAAGAGVEFDFRDHIQLPDGRRIVSSVSASLPGVSASIQGTTVRLSSGRLAHGGVRFVLKLCVPIVGYCFYEAFSGTVARAGRVKSEYSDGVRERVEGGMRTYVSPQLGGYFEFPAGSELSYRLQGALRDSTGFVVNGAQWHIGQGSDRVSVNVPSIVESLPVMTDATVIARDQHGTEATLRFFITFTEEGDGGSPGGTPAPASAACERMLGLYAEWVAALNERERACPADRSGGTVEEEAARAASRLEGLNRISSGDSPLPSELSSGGLFWCAVDKGPGSGRPPAVEAALNAASRAIRAAIDSYSAAHRELERASPGGGAGGICGYGSG